MADGSGVERKNLPWKQSGDSQLDSVADGKGKCCCNNNHPAPTTFLELMSKLKSIPVEKNLKIILDTLWIVMLSDSGFLVVVDCADSGSHFGSHPLELMGQMTTFATTTRVS